MTKRVAILSYPSNSFLNESIKVNFSGNSNSFIAIKKISKSFYVEKFARYFPQEEIPDIRIGIIKILSWKQNKIQFRSTFELFGLPHPSGKISEKMDMGSKRKIWEDQGF